MAALGVVPSPAVTAAPLYSIEVYLAALIETAELVPPEQEQEFRAEFQTALMSAIEKRDRVGQFMAHLEQQIEFANHEINRLKQRKLAFERALARVEAYIVETIERLGKDEKGKFRTLEGRTITFSLRLCPPSVEVRDEGTVPPAFKTVVLKMPATFWEHALEALPTDQRAAILKGVQTVDIQIDKRSVKAAIDSGERVPGADLIRNRYALRTR